MIETAHLGADTVKLEQFLIGQGYEISEKLHGQDTVFVKKNVTWLRKQARGIINNFFTCYVH